MTFSTSRSHKTNLASNTYAGSPKMYFSYVTIRDQSDYIYIYAFSRRFYPKRLTIAFRLYIFCQYMCSLESNPQPFALLTQCSTTEPHRNTTLHLYFFFQQQKKTNNNDNLVNYMNGMHGQMSFPKIMQSG